MVSNTTVPFTTFVSVQSADGDLEIFISPASIELRLTEETAKEFDEACQEIKDSTWLPIWKQIKSGLLSTVQRFAHKHFDRIKHIPLEAVTEVRYTDNKLEIFTEDGNQLSGFVTLKAGSFDRKWQFDLPELFPEQGAQRFVARFNEIKPIFDEYIQKIQE